MNIDKLDSNQHAIPMSCAQEIPVLTPPVLTSSHSLSECIQKVRNAQNPQITSPIQEKSAAIIKNFMRKVIAAQSYGKMFSQGQRFTLLDQALPNTDSKHNFNALIHLDSLSQQYLQKIKADTPNLTFEERKLLTQIVDTKWTLRHQSNSNLVKAGKLLLFSSDKLANEKIITHQNTYEGDKIALSNHDFVFFGVEFSEDKNAMPLNHTHMGVDFGANAYLIDDTQPHGYLTLTDHFENCMPHPHILEHKEFAFQYQKTVKEAFRQVMGEKGEIDVPIFNSKDMKLGLGLHVIHFLRQSQDQAFKHFALHTDLTSHQLDKVINFIFQPEFHLPHMLSTTDYTAVSLRDISLTEAIKASNLERIDELVNSKEQACEAMEIAIKENKEGIIHILFERFTFTRQDVPLMSINAELTYNLSKSAHSSVSVLKRFIENDLIDIHKPFQKNHNPDCTMLDNALKTDNEEMIRLLKELGVQTKEEIKANIEQFVLNSEIAKLDSLLFSKKHATQALQIAVIYQKVAVIEHLLKKYKWTPDEVKSIRCGKPYDTDLRYVLSHKDANLTILRLFLEKNLIDINAPFVFQWTPKTMFENAFQQGRKDIVALLKIYGKLDLDKFKS